MRPYEHQFDLGPQMDPPTEAVPVYPIRNKTDLRVIRRRIEATPQGTAEELRPEWERLIDTLRNKLPSDVPFDVLTSGRSTAEGLGLRQKMA